MAPIGIGIDLTQWPQKIGRLLNGQIVCFEGSKGLKLTGAAASTTEEEVVACLEDAAGVVKGFFDAPNFDAAVIVVPNVTSQRHQDEIISYGRGAGFNVTQVICEHTAGSFAYFGIEKPFDVTKLGIFSMFNFAPLISVINLDSVYTHYRFVLEEYEAYSELIALEEKRKEQVKGQGSGSGIIGNFGVESRELVVEDPIEKALGILNNILANPKIKSAEVDKLVFIGKASRSEKLRKAVKQTFSNAEVWEGIDNPDEIVVYGAAYLSSEDKKMPMNRPDDPNVDLGPEIESGYLT